MVRVDSFGCKRDKKPLESETISDPRSLLGNRRFDQSRDKHKTSDEAQDIDENLVKFF